MKKICKKLPIAVSLVLFCAFQLCRAQTADTAVADTHVADVVNKVRELNHLSEKRSKNSSRAAVAYAKEALVLSQMVNDTAGIAESMLNIGVAYRYLQALDVSLEYLLRAQKQFTYLGSKKLLAVTLGRIGDVYYGLGYLDRSLGYYKRALAIHSENKDSLGISGILNGMGLVYNEKDEHEKALTFLQRSYAIEKQYGGKKGKARIFNNLGIVYSDMGLYSRALPLYKEALAMNTSLSDTWAEIEVLNNLGLVYTNMGRYADARNALLKSRTMVEQIQDRNLLLDNYLYSAILFEALGDYKQEAEYRKRHHEMYTSVASAKKQDNVSELQVLFATEAKDAQIQLLQSEQELKNATIKAQRFWILFIIALCVCIAGSSALLLVHIRHKLETYKLLAKKNMKIVEYEKFIDTEDRSAMRTFRRSQIKRGPAAKGTNESKYSGSSLSEEQKKQIFDKIINIIEEEKYFMQHDASLENVSKLLEINRSYLSQVINEEFGKSFNNVINEYRVHEARMLLAGDSARIFTIASVAQSVGFNSVNVFNKAFKRYTGITPSFFIQSLQKEDMLSSVSTQ